MLGAPLADDFLSFPMQELPHLPPPLSSPIKATDLPSTEQTQPTPSASTAVPEDDPRTAEPGRPARKALADNQPGDTDPVTSEKPFSGTEKPSGHPSVEEAGGGISEGGGKLGDQQKTPGVAAGSAELAGKRDPGGEISANAARVESTLPEKESVSAAVRGGAIDALGKGADVDVGKGADISARLDADVTGQGTADVANADVAVDGSADAPTKKDLLAEIERELRERERVVQASASLGGSPAAKRRAAHSPNATAGIAASGHRNRWRHYWG